MQHLVLYLLKKKLKWLNFRYPLFEKSKKKKKLAQKGRKPVLGESLFLDGLIPSVGPEADIIAGLHAFEVNMRQALSAEKTRI